MAGAPDAAGSDALQRPWRARVPTAEWVVAAILALTRGLPLLLERRRAVARRLEPFDVRLVPLVDERLLALMRTGALLVNAGRGPLVDTEALVEALTGGRIRAARDVTDPAAAV